MTYSVAEYQLAKRALLIVDHPKSALFGRNQTLDAVSDKNVHTNTQQGLYTNRSTSANIMGWMDPYTSG